MGVGTRAVSLSVIQPGPSTRGVVRSEACDFCASVTKCYMHNLCALIIRQYSNPRV